MSAAMRSVFYSVILWCAVSSCGRRNQRIEPEHSLSGFTHWKIGKDTGTTQLIPPKGNDPVVIDNDIPLVHVKFHIWQYGEASFPIDKNTPIGEEARKVDLSDCEFITVTYQANHKVILQLRQTGVHGGIQNQVYLPPSQKFSTVKIPLSDFKGGRSPLDLHDVSKFNFAFLSNNEQDGVAELRITGFTIDHYKP